MSIAQQFQKRRRVSGTLFYINSLLAVALIMKWIPENYFWFGAGLVLAGTIFGVSYYRCPSCMKPFPRAMRNPIFNAPKSCPNCHASFET